MLQSRVLRGYVVDRRAVLSGVKGPVAGPEWHAERLKGARLAAGFRAGFHGVLQPYSAEIVFKSRQVVLP